MLDERLAEWSRTRAPHEIVELLWPLGIAVSEVCGASELRANQQLDARGFLERLDHPVAGDHDGNLAMPFTVDGPSQWNRTAAPRLGEHNRHVLATILGLDDATIDDSPKAAHRQPSCRTRATAGAQAAR